MMTGKEKISTFQVAILIVPVIVATEIFSAPGTSAEYAKEDAWISILLTSVTGVWSLFVMLALAIRYPGLTPIEYSQEILGKWLGILVGWYYVFVLFWYPATISDEMMNFIRLFANPTTPRVAILLLFIFVCGAVVWAGIEAIARCAELIVPINIIFILITSFLLFGDMEGKYLKPVLGHGLIPVLQGAVVPSAWTGEFFMIGFLLPFVKKSTQVRRAGVISLGIVMLLMVWITLQSLTVDGEITGKMNYAFYAATRYVSIADFFERIDPVIVEAWVFGGFLKNSVFLWALCISVAQLLGYENYRTLVVPLSLMTLVACLWFYSNAFEMQDFLKYTFPSWGLINQNIIPTMLLMVDLARRRRKAQSA
ncbi:spore germination protein [Alicyclobacillus fastidiosus]|uniref:Spore germination protein n=1 Tax=Alicyclobacillus fastidiosus TaxID=392011 RepID=A0ABY6ZC26_9BACL|nr:endospore germination permease [Alicyclobacillus fastidiosus]WAH40285.1 spore germination protein [Alicyclobacillus fastidiosus]GMA61662.1 germination protein [Alicyclobacillus fastidiosus]